MPLLACIFSGLQAQNSWNDCKEKGNCEITVFYFDFEPFFYEEKGVLKGIEYAILEEFTRFVKAEYGISVSTRYVPEPSFPKLYNTIKEGKPGYFGAASFSITPKRQVEVDFTPEYIPDIEVLICSNNVPVANDTLGFVKVFEKLKALSMPGSTYEQNLLQLKGSILPNMEIESLEHFDEIAHRIASEHDLFGYAQLSSYLLARKKGQRIKRQNLFKVEKDVGQGIAFPKNSGWEVPVAAFFASEAFSEGINGILKQYFGDDVSDLIKDMAAGDKTDRSKNISLLTKENEIQSLELEKQALEMRTQEIIRNSTIAGACSLLILTFLIYSRYRIKKKGNELLLQKNHEIEAKSQELMAQAEELQQLNEETQAQRDFITEQNKELQFQNRQITDSIRAAQLIQNAMLPYEHRIKSKFDGFFAIYRPKDVVSGDFYWLAEFENKALFAVVDCTGHGIPGAFMSMIGDALLDKVVLQLEEKDPAKVLELLDIEVHMALSQDDTGDMNGMDVALISVEKLPDGQFKIIFAGAKRPLYLCRKGSNTLEVLPGDRRVVGGATKHRIPFTNKEAIVEAGSLLFMATDGFTDQNNRDRKKFSKKRLVATIQENLGKPLDDIKVSIEKELNDFQDDMPQRDDIVLVGLRL